MKSKIVAFSIFAALIVILALAFGHFENSKSKPKKVECLGDELTAPHFTLVNLRGEKVDSSDFKGKVVLVEFWATWCAPCQKEIPYLNELYQKYKKDGLVVIGIALDRGEPEGVKRFVERYGVEYVNLMGNDGVLEAFGKFPGMGPIQGIPTTFLIDRKGQICRRFVGLTEKRVFEEALKQFLWKKT